mmetsp:Transcript_72102/g.181787  ORF Transcript_72102/g.181787 Transcript_72102/m.181787 type:complete len:253 (-) Transcript_72102:39-797(-)
MADPSPMLPAAASSSSVVSSSSSERPQLLYALVARSTGQGATPEATVLAEHAAADGISKEVLIQNLLKNIESSEVWQSYFYDKYGFHCLMEVETGLRFVCLADKDMGRRLPCGLLCSLQESFNQWYGPPEVAAALPGGMQADFNEEIKTLVNKYNAPDADRVTVLSEKVRGINNTLAESMEKIMERQEKIDVLVDRSQMLHGAATSFRRDAARLQRKLWWKNARVIFCICFVAILAIVFVVMAECGFSLHHC